MGLVVGTASVNQTPLDWRGNKARIVGACEEAATRRPDLDLLLFPELCVTGYGCEDMFSSPDLLFRARTTVTELARTIGEWLPDGAVVVGLPLEVDGQVYNCAAVLFGGQVVGIVPKSRLAGDGVHYEPRWFAAFSHRATGAREVEWEGRRIPFGRLLFGLRGAQFAIEICEDAWVANRPALDYAAAGCELILNPSASHFAFGKHAVRRRIVLESSRAFGMAYVLVNLLGNEAGRMIYDGDAVAASAGEVCHEARPFSFSDRVVSAFEIDLDRDRVLRARTYSMQSYRSARRASQVRTVLLGEGRGRDTTRAAERPARSGGTICISEKQEIEFLRAVTLGLFDYWRKAHVRGLVVSLSGGVDSAACAVLAHRTLAYSFAELGPERALERLGLKHEIAPLSTSLEARGHSIASCRSDVGLLEATRLAAGRMLHTIYQATAQSGPVTRDAAAGLARALGAAHVEADVEELVLGYRKRIEPALGRTLTWEQDDLALQNIQARVRSPLAWLLANTTGSLLLTTSNRSEAAVGYCTMDGDTSGGLAPLSGIDKDFLRRWLSWMQTEGDELCGCIPELEAVNRQAPTAELRPPEQGQTDEADLMPYALLDQIEKLAIRDRKPPAEVFRILRSTWPAAALRAHIRRFYTLWAQNQWKRERYAPSFHLDDENLDPRTWYRFPILSGAFVQELADLDREND